MSTFLQQAQEEAARHDAADVLAPFRAEFCFPQTARGEDVVYFTGNSLGLMPRSTRQGVLDELDAPLDESNIGRFVKVLDRFIDRSQFIIVTHSKRTMARADVMYGVTMEEFGVSKPVGMRLTAASSEDKNEAKSAAQKAALRLDA